MFYLVMAAIIGLSVGIIFFMEMRKYQGAEREELKKWGKYLVIGSVVVMLLVFAVEAMVNKNPGLGSNDEPWKDLGVSEKEYMEHYNYHNNQLN